MRNGIPSDNAPPKALFGSMPQTGLRKDGRGQRPAQQILEIHKGIAARARYQKTGATARNNQTYRRRLRKYYETFLALKEKHGYKKLTVKLLFGNGENQIPERAAYRMFELLDNKYYWRSKYMWRPDPNGYWKWKFPIDDRLCTELLEFVFGITSAEVQPAEAVTA